MESAEQPIQDRHLRVFISSTFRDMHAERNYLVKFIFPQLRRLCESRGVTWGEVDLRWGVTDESAAEGKVLPICLEEINRCRPYFVGLLGERYGWVPESIPEELLEKETWLREQFREHKSVTELEILHGVLRNPEMADNAFFYFRDSAYVHTMPEQDRKDFISESSEDAEKLKELKDRIRKSNFPVRENYPDSKALGDLVLADLTSVINERWPEGSEPDQLTREALDHAAYARSRERVYIERQEYFTRLDAHAAGNGDQPLVILGESGSGKSALLANWALRYRKANPDVFVLEHYIGATPASADWAAMLRRIMGEFKERLGLSQDIPEHPDALRSAFPNWLYMAAAKSRIVLVLDALNQLEDRDGAPDLLWLPPVMPENLRLIVSTLPGRALDEITKRNWSVYKVEPLSVEERKELIRRFLHDYSRELSPSRVERIANATQSSNPLYLRVLLDELRLFGIHERLEERIGYYLQAGSPYDLYEKVIIRWEKDYEGDSDLVGDTLSLLWASRRGLSETELLDALGKDGEPLPRAHWSPLFLAMADGLVSRGGLLTFAHDFLRTAARDAYLPSESHQQQAHCRLADYFERQTPGQRRTDELPWQLAEGLAWQRLHDLLVDREFFAEAWERNQFEVKSYWAKIEANSPLRMVNAYREQIEHPEDEQDINYLWLLGILLNYTGHPEEALRIRSTIVHHFRETGDLVKLQAALGHQAQILQVCGKFDEAMALHKEEEHICRQLGNLEQLSCAIGNQAVMLQVHGDLDGAMTIYKEIERVSRLFGNLDDLNICLGNQAVILADRGKLNEAMAVHKEEERICRQLGNLDGLQRSLGNRGLILANQGELDGALSLYEEKERICRQLGNIDGLQRTLGNKALIFADRGELDKAMALHKESEQMCRQLHNLNGVSTSLGHQALILYDQGDKDRAITLHKEEERICRQLGNLDGLFKCIGNQAVILADHGKLNEAMTLHIEVERICRQLGHLDGLQHALANQAEIFYMLGDLDKATNLYKEQESICRQLGSIDGLQVNLGGRANILYVCGKLNEAIALYKEQERICHQLGHPYSLARCLINQALAFKQLSRFLDALPLAEEAYRVATQHGFAGLASQITPTLDSLRQANNRG